MMVFKLAQSAEKKWYRLRGFKLLADVITGVKLKDGERIIQDQAEHQPMKITRSKRPLVDLADLYGIRRFERKNEP